MTLRNLSIFLFATTLSLSLIACGDDEEGGEDTQDAGTDTSDNSGLAQLGEDCTDRNCDEGLICFNDECAENLAF